VLADLCVESEAATMLMMRLARAFDRRSDKDFESPFGRIATAISKYWVCKRASAVAYEALECLGGAGYVEESILPRIYREALLNSIWEGSGNVNCLDVFRTIGKEPGALPALRQELDGAKGGDPRYDAFVASLDKDLVRAAADPAGAEVRARVLVERMALALQGSLVQSCRSLYQAKITERRARGPPNFVALPRNLFQNFGAPRSRLEIPEWFGRPYLRPYSVVAL
jgi:putative acyl-CoA dehydrogenase